MERPTIQAGTYRHFKGGLYAVIGVAQLVDSDECFVVYHPLYGDQELVIRPVQEFIGTVVRNGREQLRFEFIESGPTNHPEWSENTPITRACRSGHPQRAE
jgi:hypothetical protein